MAILNNYNNTESGSALHSTSRSSNTRAIFKLWAVTANDTSPCSFACPYLPADAPSNPYHRTHQPQSLSRYPPIIATRSPGRQTSCEISQQMQRGCCDGELPCHLQLPIFRCPEPDPPGYTNHWSWSGLGIVVWPKWHRHTPLDRPGHQALGCQVAPSWPRR